MGLLTDSDTRQHEGYLESTRVSAAMKPNPMTVPPELLALDVARLLVEHKIGGFPVMDSGEPVEIVTTSDLKLLGRAKNDSLDMEAPPPSNPEKSPFRALMALRPRYPAQSQRS